MDNVVMTSEQFNQLIELIDHLSFVGMLTALFLYDCLSAGFRCFVTKIDAAIEKRQQKKYALSAETSSKR
ncbi:hypothetical protein [Photobacterium sp. J15]|uniref:hypothetical protein n=1 Tax=Photobacterium sp. J15 TaxID=265901 RepID=UPI0007E4D46C|nr:hypothetical protein [Photobacterium sp. J15]